MRWIYITVFFFMSMTGVTLSAQGGIGAGGSVFNDTILFRINQRLLLTDDQYPQVEAMLEAYQNDLASNPPVSREDKRARKRALRTRIMGILTPEQKARAKARRSGGGKRSAPTPQKRSWFDVLLDDVASPLLERRKRGGGEP